MSESQLESILTEYAERVRAGQSPHLDEYLERYPQLADEIQTFFRGLDSTLDGDAEPPSLIGAQIGTYVLQEQIGRGGMGTVYRARQLGLERPVAIKMISSGVLASPEERRRFQTEAEAAARVQHPGIIPIYEVGSWRGHAFYCMPLIDGPTLQSWVEERSCRPHEAARIMSATARAVDHAHHAGLVHRDLKPANILVNCAGQPQLTDFGLAKWYREGTQLTHTGQLLGTPHYMSPEQAAGRHHIGPATDIYALGATLYALLTGQPPHFDSTSTANTPADVLRRVLQDDPLPPKELCAEVPTDLQRICLKCLQRDPEDRYPTAAAFADDLDRFISGDPVEAGRSGLVHFLSRSLRRDPHHDYFENWGRALFLMGLVIFLAHASIFVLSRLDVSVWISHRLPRTLMFIALAALLYVYRGGAILPRSAAERPVWSIWAGYLASLAVINTVLVLGETPRSVNYAIVAALGGFGFIAMGGHIWGGCQLLGLLFLAAALPAIQFPTAAPLIVGIAWLISLATLAHRYRRRAATAIANPQGTTLDPEVTPTTVAYAPASRASLGDER